MIEALDIHVQGIVQGVGFRPFVYRMAKKYLINGWVLNAADGVRIHAEGEGRLLDEFVLELSEHAPAAAKVSQIELKEVPLEDCESFEIRFSDAAEVEQTTLVSPELATCDDCLRELFNPNDRRYRYPFINCTNCGPRFTIIENLPYDRKNTSMRDFTMCDHCAAEYADPLDRRFHAQPDACFECGPAVTWRESPSVRDVGAGAGSFEPNVVYRGSTRAESDAIFARAVEMLCAGKILAVKGLGGFHLVCDANNASAVATLRARKHREGKAFAVMLADVAAVREVCEVNEVEEAVLTGAQRPIVLLRKRADAAGALVPRLADGLSELGVMLPYTPVQHLLMHDFSEVWRARRKDRGSKAGGGDNSTGGGANGESVSRETLGEPSCSVGSSALSASGSPPLPPMLVMTSGNLHDEPIVMNDEEAYVKLASVADAFLGNDRMVLTRFDDSVVRVVRAGSAGYAVQFIRRARGYSPLPLELHLPGSVSGGAQPVVFATGPEQKNTFTLLRGGETREGEGSSAWQACEAFVSQHIGDMENAETYDAWLAAKKRYEMLFELEPSVVACDLHPEYLTSKWAHDQALPVIKVQHHHAHVASVMAEHGLSEAVCGIAFDGTGYGTDGAIWGGEVLLANLQAFERFANFAYVPMPGGAAAVKHPLRMAYGVLWAYDLLEHPGAQVALATLGSQAGICDAMIEQGINTPMTSSVGRLFDAASALLGLCVEPTYEGEGACLLEAAISDERASSAKIAQETPAVSSVSSVAASCCDAAGESNAVCEAFEKAEEHDSSEKSSDLSFAEDPAVTRERYAVAVTKNVATEASTAQDTSVLLLDAAPTFRALLDDMVAGVPRSTIARRFHDAFVGAVVTSAELVRALYGINTVVLSGGVFMNRYLVEHALAALEGAGFTAAISRDVPPNDGCISLGQAVVAWAQKQAR